MAKYVRCCTRQGEKPHGFVLCETGHEAAGSASAACVRARDHFQAMAVGVGEIDPAAAIVVIDLAGAAAHRIGPMVETSLLLALPMRSRTRERTLNRRPDDEISQEWLIRFAAVR